MPGNNKVSKDFGNKEFLLNYANRRWGLTKTSKVGEVMALIRECQPKSWTEWEDWYFSNALTKTKEPQPVSRKSLEELGVRLYEKLVGMVYPQMREAMRCITKEDCIDYIYQITICRTYDGFLTEKSVIYDNLAKHFPNVVFEETSPELDHAGDIDYIGRINDKAFGIQVKPVTAHANLGNYDVSARMEQSFRSFEQEYGGKVFIVFSTDDRVRNEEVYESISKEIDRLTHI